MNYSPITSEPWQTVTRNGEFFVAGSRDFVIEQVTISVLNRCLAKISAR